MRIAFIYKNFPSLGGAERVMTVIANEFVKKGMEIVIYSFQQKLDKPVYPLEESIRVLLFPDNKNITSSINVNYLSENLVNKKISVILNHDTMSDSMQLCKRVKDKTKIPLITLHHGQIYLSWSSLAGIVRMKQGFNVRKTFFPLYYLYVVIREYLHHKRNIKICDSYVVLSQSFQCQLGGNSKIQTIENPLSFSLFFDMNQYDKKENVVVMVGRISEFHKRFSLALRAWKNIEMNSSFSSWSFEIVGDGNDLPMVKNMISELGLHRVNIVGYANPEPYYKRAKIFFMTSAFEGFPLVLLEAAQNACVPIVMDSFETVHDIIEDKRNGLIIPNGNIESFVSGAEMLITHPEQLQKMADFAVKNSHKYNPSIVVNKWISLLGTLSVK